MRRSDSLWPKVVAASPWACLAVGMASSLLAVFVVYRPIEESYMVYYSWLMSLGRVPYRDFFVVYPPGAFAFLGLAFKVFGASALLARFTVLLSSLLVAWFTFLLAQRLAVRRAALVCAGITLAWGLPVYNSSHPNWYALPLLMGAAVAACGIEDGRGTGRLGRVFLVGVLVGVAATVKQSIGLLGLMAFGVVVLVATRAKPAGSSKATAWADSTLPMIVYLIGFALPGVVTAGSLWNLGATRQAIAAIVAFPTAHRDYFLTQTLPRMSMAGAATVLAFAVLVIVRLAEPRLSVHLRLVRTRSAVVVGGLGSSIVLALLWRLHPPSGGLGDVLNGAAWSLVFYGLPIVVFGLGVARSRGILRGEGRQIPVAAAAAVAAAMFFERGGALDWNHLMYVVPPALVLAVWLVPPGQDGNLTLLRAGLLWALAPVLLFGPLAPRSADYVALLGGHLKSLPGRYRGVMVDHAEAAQFRELFNWLSAAPAGKTVYAYPIDLGPVFAASRVSAGYYLQLVYRLEPGEVASETRRIRSDHPAVVIARNARPWTPTDPGKYSNLNPALLQAAVEGLSVVDGTRDFTVYASRPPR